MGWACSWNGREEAEYMILLEKPEGKGPLLRPRCRWVNNIKMDLRVIVCSGIDWVDLAQDKNTRRALLNMVMNLRIP
jgi:hypothetical protein